METNDFNIYYLALTAVIALTPFLAILINQLLSLKSDMIAQDTVIQAKQANEISKQALEVAMFSYKGDIIPVIVGEVRWHLTNLKPYYQIYFNLHNKGRGPAIIESIKPDNDNFLIEELFDEETKIEQFGKNVTEIRDNRLYMYKITFKEEENPPDLRTMSRDEVRLYLNTNYLNKITDTTFAVRFFDQIGTYYLCHLKIDKKDLFFKGEPMEFEKRFVGELNSL